MYIFFFNWVHDRTWGIVRFAVSQAVFFAETVNLSGGRCKCGSLCVAATLGRMVPWLSSSCRGVSWWLVALVASKRKQIFRVRSITSPDFDKSLKRVKLMKLMKLMELMKLMKLMKPMKPVMFAAFCNVFIWCFCFDFQVLVSSPALLPELMALLESFSSTTSHVPHVPRWHLRSVRVTFLMAKTVYDWSIWIII